MNFTIPSIFTRRKPLYFCNNSSINEILLRELRGIGEKLDKGEQSVDALEGFDEICLAIVVDMSPLDCTWKRGILGTLLDNDSIVLAVVSNVLPTSV